MLTQEDFIDWGTEEEYIKQIGIGECAGVVIDLIATLFLESHEKIEKAKESFIDNDFSSSIYHAYSSMVNSAKALLLADGIKTNSQAKIISQFDEYYVQTKKIALDTSFSDLIYQINKYNPKYEFSKKYIKDAELFLQQIRDFREKELAITKSVINEF